MTDNEKRLVESIVEMKSNVFKVQQYIKETYGIDSQYDEDECTLTLLTNGVNENLSGVDFAFAKEYCENNIDKYLLKVQID